MIQHIENTKCETNMTGSTSFSIQANAKMFKILSSGLYSNKERAIIREVSCNAYDANVDAGNEDIPIEVHLPNTLEPFFSIKDCGPGLTPDQMVNVYTQYGNSTKTDRNDQIGALGLGSKSPFSYIDSFTVISITGGEKNTYSCYIDGQGQPQLQPFGNEKTNEPNGVEVTFPVKLEDFYKFREESELVFRPFNVKPKVSGNSLYKVKEFEVLTSSEDSDTADWQLVKSIGGSSYNREYIRVAVQGNIEYPINTRLIEDSLSNNAKLILNESYRLHFNIGDLDIAASREELGYDKVTIENIAKKYETMATELVRVQNEKINCFETKYEAMQYISELKYGTNIYKDFKFTYKDETITNHIDIPSELKVVRYSKKSNGNITRKNLAKDLWNTNYSIAIPRDETNVVWVFNDDMKKTVNITKARSLVTYSNNVYLIEDKKFLDLLGNPDYIKASTIERVKKNLQELNFQVSILNYFQIIYGQNLNGNLIIQMQKAWT